MKFIKTGLLVIALTLFAQNAKADIYAGGLVGYGTTAGDGVSVTGGLALGATVGIQLMPNLGIAGTYFHNALSSGGVDFTDSQYLLEANFFSVLFFPSGVHFGQVHRTVGSFTSNDFGAGLHTGFDFPIVANVTVGLAAYWTYVTEDNNKHSLLEVVAPIKFHF